MMPVVLRLTISGIASAVLLSSATNPGYSQSPDPAKGEELAKQHCTSCHDPSDAKGGNKNGRYVPSMPELAGRPHYSTVKLRRIIAVPPHRDMPNMSLKKGEIDHLAAYIRSLRKPKK